MIFFVFIFAIATWLFAYVTGYAVKDKAKGYEVGVCFLFSILFMALTIWLSSNL